MAIDLEKGFGFLAFTRKSARGEYAALMRGVQRRRAIGMGFGEDNAALGNHAVHVIDRAGNELLQQIKRLLIAELVEPVPQLVGVMNLLHAYAGGLRTRLEQPRVGNAGHEFPKTAVIKDGD